MKKKLLKRKAAFTAAFAVVVGGIAVLPAADGSPVFGTVVSADDGDDIVETHKHNLRLMDSNDPTCTQDGQKAYYLCQDLSCGKKFLDSEGKNEVTNVDDLKLAAGHGTRTHHAAVAATCTNDGNDEYWECGVCGKLLDSDSPTANIVAESDVFKTRTGHDFTGNYTGDTSGHWHVCQNAGCDVKSPAVGHTWDYDNGVEKKPANCTEAGEVEYTCSAAGCGQKKTETVPKTAHSYVTLSWESDSKNHWHECSSCSDKTDTGAHVSDGGKVTTPPTKSAKGTRTYSCVTCGYVIKTESIDILGDDHADTHDPKNAIIKYDSSGHWYEYPCCGEKISVATHNLKDDEAYNKANAATCTSGGSKKKKCSLRDCGYEEITYTTALEHDTENIALKPASCDKEGNTAGTKCKRCGEDTSRVIPKTEHTLGSWKIGNEGHYKLCTICGHHVDSNNIDIGTGEEAHIWDMGEITTAPTADTTGTRTYTCKVCLETKTETVPKRDPDHVCSYTTWVDKGDYHIKQCSCGELDPETKASHTKDSGTVTKPATQTETGTKVFKCSVCGKIMDTQTIPALPAADVPGTDKPGTDKPGTDKPGTDTPAHTHSYSESWSYNSTSHWRVCSCGEKFNNEKHVSDGGTVVNGVRYYKCFVCGYNMGSTVVSYAPVTVTSYPSTVFTGYLPYSYYYYYNPYYYYTPKSSSSSSRTLTVNTGSSVTEKELTFTWDKVSGAKKYTVYRYSESTGKYTKVKETTGTSYTMTNPRNGMTYKFMVKYTAANGKQSADALSGKITVKANFKPAVTAKAGKNSIKLSWQTVKGAEKYAVYRYVNGKGSKITETESTTATIKGLESGKKYSYVVRAYVDGKWTSMTKSDIVTATTTK